MIINRTKSVFDNFIALIKESNPSFEDVTEDQVILGLPVVDNSVQGRNTKIEITAKANSGYSGTRTLYYSRCSLSELIEESWIPGIINLEVFDTGGDVVDMILLNMGSMANQIVINEGDSVVLPDFLSSGEISVRSVINSIIFADEEVEVTVNNDLTGEFFDYRYEDWVGSTVVFNYAPNQIHGTRIGNQPTTIPGIVGNAWNPGNPACVINTGQKLPGGALSFTTRVRMWSVNGQQYIMGNVDANGANASAGVIFGFLNANFIIKVGNGVSVWQDSTVPHGISVGQTVDIGFSISKTGLVKIYKNGALVGTKQAGVARITTQSYNNIYVGQAGEYGFKFGNNFVDRTRMWNRELSEAEFALVQNVLSLKNSKWNALDKGPSVTLEEDSRIAKCSVGSSVRGVVGLKTGKHMFEITVTSGDTRLLLGAGRKTALLNYYPGYESISFSYFAFTGNFLNGSTNGVAYGQTYAVGDVIGVGVDFDNNEVEFFKNGVSQGIKSVALGGEYYYPMIGCGTLNSIQQGGLLNVGEEGFAFPQVGYEPWFYDVDGSGMIAGLSHPISVVEGETDTQFKERLANWFGVAPTAFKLGDDADDVFSLPVMGDNDVEIRITSVSDSLWLNSDVIGRDKIKVRFPYMLIDDLTEHIGTTGWLYDEDLGWYNNNYAWDTNHTLQNIPSHTLTSLKKMSGLFNQYNDSPSGGMGQNFVTAVNASGSWNIGTVDGNTTASQGMGSFNEGVYTVSTANRLGFLSTFTLNGAATFTAIHVRSNYYQTYPRGRRGIKWLRFDYMASEI